MNWTSWLRTSNVSFKIQYLLSVEHTVKKVRFGCVQGLGCGQTVTRVSFAATNGDRHGDARGTGRGRLGRMSYLPAQR